MTWIPFDSLPPDVKARILGRPPSERKERPRAKPSKTNLGIKCPCGSQVIRPDDNYPDCPGCGKPLRKESDQ